MTTTTKGTCWRMFNQISECYDFVNRLMTLGIDMKWRKKLLGYLPQKKQLKILDLATGTGDIAFAIRKKYSADITGIDLSVNMLKVAKDKSNNLKINDIHFIEGDAEALPFEDSTFDKLVISYGLRNLGNPEKGLREFFWMPHFG